MTMFDDPPAPKPLQPGEKPPTQSAAESLTPGGQTTTWVFNPEYQKLVDLWQQVVKLLDELVALLDQPLQMAKSTDVWDAPVAKGYIEKMTAWRGNLVKYRKAVLSEISSRAAATPRWVAKELVSPKAFMS